jgi:cystathionine beta-lyase/cystathionine gamma-synthase
MPDPTERPATKAPRGFATRAIRAAHRLPEVDQPPTSVPIYQTVTFEAGDATELGDVLSDRIRGYAYGRIDNPTIVAAGRAIAELEGAEAGQVFATGMAAIHAALVSVARAGDRVVAATSIYGSTRSLLTGALARLGIETEFVDITDHGAVEAALRGDNGTGRRPAAALYAETIANPTIVVADHAALAGIAHRHGAAYLVDNTFASPYLCRPLEFGVDLVIESATKFLAGHSDVLAGVVVGSRDRVEGIRLLQVDTGASLAPLSAFLVLRGLSTLAIRMDRHAASAAALAAWLERQGGVRRVFHPSLATHPQHRVAARQLAAGGGMLAFELADRTAGAAFIDALELPPRTASLGAVFTMVVHPASTTHRQLDDVALAEAGIAPGLLRCSVGLEDVDDLIADFEVGLAAARGAATEQIDDQPADAPPQPAAV